ncbi:SH3 domain-containing protein [Spironucleus salmonicida]|uniref:SH3 domain-containing protein n=1 Tax=Spironucleus salmonicida TaxID=348837 RepID=V6LMS7_9EUKA|nr:SH3 domain-containing protein [Spironucleus salmonicida]|eukprot:EST45992.1 SH3 domain-containing protein [Spironucleus salmonicida]
MSVIQCRKATKDYTKKRDDMMTIQANDIIEVYKIEKNGWSHGKNLTTNTIGWFPHAFTVLNETENCDSQSQDYESLLNQELQIEHELRQKLVDVRQQKQLNIMFQIAPEAEELEQQNLLLKQQILLREKEVLLQKCELLRLLGTENDQIVYNNEVKNYSDLQKSQEKAVDTLSKLTEELTVQLVSEKTVCELQQKVDELNTKVRSARSESEGVKSKIVQDIGEQIKQQKDGRLEILLGIDYCDIADEYLKVVSK